MTDKTYSLYFLICPIENIVRYVGVSVEPKKRLMRHCSPCEQKENSHKFRWIRKLRSVGQKPILEIILDNLTIEEASKLEIQYIKLYRQMLGGKLTNIAVGGNVPPPQFGDKNFLRTERGRLLSSLRNSGKGHANYGRRGGESFNSKPVDQYSLDGKFIKSYNSLIEAEAALSQELHSSHIGDCCKKKIKKSIGFIWRWKGDPLGEVNLKSKKEKRVDQIDMKTKNLIETFETIRAAEAKLEIDYNSISRACKHKGKKGQSYSAGGYFWRYHV